MVVLSCIFPCPKKRGFQTSPALNSHLSARLHEPRLAANPDQVASAGPPFSGQTLVTVQALDWKKVDPVWRPDLVWQPTRAHVNGP